MDAREARVLQAVNGFLSRRPACVRPAIRFRNSSRMATITLDETARALDISHATVERDWVLAKAWLHQRLS